LKEGGSCCSCLIQKEQQNYRYVFEELGSFPCLQARQGDAFFGTKHWRLSLKAVNKAMVLQIRFAEICKELMPCLPQKVTQIKAGMMSWQLID
jgi:hypothetical protein